MAEGGGDEEGRGGVGCAGESGGGEWGGGSRVLITDSAWQWRDREMH